MSRWPSAGHLAGFGGVQGEVSAFSGLPISQEVNLVICH